MTALAAGVITQTRGEPQLFVSIPVVASDIIYEGGLVSVNSAGNAIPAADTASTLFVGIADETVDNSAGAAGAKNVRVKCGVEALYTASSITLAMTGGIMYIVDDQTIDDAAGPTNDIACGILTEFVSTTSGWVWFPVGGTNAI